MTDAIGVGGSFRITELNCLNLFYISLLNFVSYDSDAHLLRICRMLSSLLSCKEPT